MTQTQYDILEFVFINKSEIVSKLTKESEHLLISKNLFDNCPELFDNLLVAYKLSKLRHLVAEHFECDFSQVCETLNENNIKEILNVE